MSRWRARSPLLVLAPIADAAGARAGLAALRALDESPFARVPGTHVARVSLLDALPGRPGGPPQVRAPHLLLAADFDGAPADWLAAVCALAPEVADELLACCAGCPGARDAAGTLRWAERFRHRAGFSVVSHDATLADVREALSVRAALRRVIAAGGGRQRFVAEIGEALRPPAERSAPAPEAP